jgi:hypothetical protein
MVGTAEIKAGAGAGVKPGLSVQLDLLCQHLHVSNLPFSYI